MEFEVLKRSYLKRCIIIGVIAVLVISAIILTFTRAKYRSVADIPIVSGTINYSLADFNAVAMYLDGKSIDILPEGQYNLTQESYCEVNGVRDDSITLNYDSSTHSLTVTPMMQRGTKCYLYFEEGVCPAGATSCSTIMANKDIRVRDLPLTTSSKIEETTTGVIYQADDDDGITYYFAGNPTDNWVSFGGFYWRIIRINGDGSIRRFMYTTSSQHGNSNNSSIKSVLDNWYQTNLSNYSSYISVDAGFCSDRNMASGYSWSSTGSNHNYSAFERLQTTNNVVPTFKCSNTNDLFTVSSSIKGNHALTYPVGLITADELVMGGIPWDDEVTNNYLFTEASYWTMTPSYFNNNRAYVFFMTNFGNLFDYRTNLTYGIRSVINLRPDVPLSGIGTTSNPYVVN